MNRIVLGCSALAIAVSASAAHAASFVPYTDPSPSMLRGAAGVSIKSLVTVGTTLPNGYQPVGIFDGIGAYKLNNTTIRAFVNNELGPTAGKSYTVSNGIGGSLSLTGARIGYYDIDIGTQSLINAGQGYDRIVDRQGNVVASTAQLGGAAGLSRFCSGALFEPNAFGAGNGLSDRIYFAGEETSNGTMYALDTRANALYAVPSMGRGAWENATQVNTGNAGKVGFILSDDTSGTANDPGSPMYLYVGTKGAVGDGSFLDRNGLARGDMYVWKSNNGNADPSQFNGNGSSRDGQWVKIINFDPSKANQPGYDAQGYASQAELRTQATAVGAFRFSRPEDVATNPGDGTLVALASTGSGLFGGADTWGTVYTLKTSFDANGLPTGAKVTVVYDGNQDAGRKLRSPDNLDWASNTELLVQEDRSADWVAARSANPNEAGILRVNLNGTVTTVARIDRSAIPFGQSDIAPTSFGEWESSGILDVSSFFGYSRGSIFLADVQAHSLRFGDAALNTALVEGSQLALISFVPEPGTWGMMLVGASATGVALRRRKRGAHALA